jgi:hypothetical protein
LVTYKYTIAIYPGEGVPNELVTVEALGPITTIGYDAYVINNEVVVDKTNVKRTFPYDGTTDDVLPYHSKGGLAYSIEVPYTWMRYELTTPPPDGYMWAWTKTYQEHMDIKAMLIPGTNDPVLYEGNWVSFGYNTMGYEKYGNGPQIIYLIALPD